MRTMLLVCVMVCLGCSASDEADVAVVVNDNPSDVDAGDADDAGLALICDGAPAPYDSGPDYPTPFPTPPCGWP